MRLWDSRFSLLFLHHNRRIRIWIRTSDERIRIWIQKAQKHTDPELDPHTAPSKYWYYMLVSLFHCRVAAILI